MLRLLAAIHLDRERERGIEWVSVVFVHSHNHSHFLGCTVVGVTPSPMFVFPSLSSPFLFPHIFSCTFAYSLSAFSRSFCLKPEKCICITATKTNDQSNVVWAMSCSPTQRRINNTHTHRKSWGKNNVALHLTLFFSVHKFAFTTLSFLTYPSLQPLFGLRDNRIFPRMPLFTFSSLPFEREKKNCTHISFAISWCLVMPIKPLEHLSNWPKFS